MAKSIRADTNAFLFRELRPNFLIGTASDRYAGWIGQIYSEGRYENGITQRSHKVGDKTFSEETLPVESVAEYFEHFPLLEIDYTFYRPLLESKGSPSSNYQSEKMGWCCIVCIFHKSLFDQQEHVVIMHSEQQRTRFHFR